MSKNLGARSLELLAAVLDGCRKSNQVLRKWFFRFLFPSCGSESISRQYILPAITSFYHRASHFCFAKVTSQNHPGHVVELMTVAQSRLLAYCTAVVYSETSRCLALKEAWSVVSPGKCHCFVCNFHRSPFLEQRVTRRFEDVWGIKHETSSKFRSAPGQESFLNLNVNITFFLLAVRCLTFSDLQLPQFPFPSRVQSRPRFWKLAAGRWNPQPCRRPEDKNPRRTAWHFRRDDLDGKSYWVVGRTWLDFWHQWKLYFKKSTTIFFHLILVFASQEANIWAERVRA